MNANEKIIRLNKTIRETEELLEKAMIRYNNSIKYLEMEIEENKEFGNDDSANDPAREYLRKDKEIVDQLKNHINKLENMIKELI